MRAYLWILAATVLACSNPATGNGGSGATADGSSTTQFGDGTTLPDGAKVETATTNDGDSASTSDLTDAAQEATAFNCTVEGKTECFNAKVVKACLNGEWVVNETCGDTEACNDGKCGTPTNCTPGEVAGCEGVATEKVCASTGKAFINHKCTGKQQCVLGKCKDVVCTPNYGQCKDGNIIEICKEDGSGFDPPAPCKPGSACLGGKCVSLCETNLKISNNVGCEYWSVDLDNAHDTFSAMLNKDGLTPDFIAHSIIISNPGQFDADITFNIASSCGGAGLCDQLTTCGKKTSCDVPSGVYQLKVTDPVVKAGQTKEFKMPVMNVDGSGIFRKAIQVKSTQPIVAFQFNPFNAEGAATNDGSLLLPVNTHGKEYYVVALGSTPEVPGFSIGISQNGYFDVVADREGDTNVTVTLTTAGIAAPGKGVPQDGTTPAKLEPGKPYQFKLKQFDVLSIQSLGEMKFSGAMDFTGSHIVADKPVAVFCGHEEAVIGNEGVSTNPNDPNAKDSCCAEHLEEQMMPLESWGNSAYCTKTKPRGTEKDLYYVVAGDANVVLKTTPPVAGLDGKTLAKAGDSLHVQTDVSFLLEGTGKIQVVQFIVSRGQTETFTGDPTMMIVPPKSQYRDNYVIQTADGYGTNWTTIVRPVGLDVKVDGQLAPGGSFVKFGDNTWELGYIEVKTGSHTLQASAPFGLMVYGYGNATAYGYPGGMNLK